MRTKGLYKGLVKTFDSNNSHVSNQFFDLYKSFKQIADQFNVSYYDGCCASAGSNGLLPVGFNATTASLSYYNPATDAIVTVGDAQSVTEITAFATGGQTSATQLSAGFNEVTVVATAGDSVKLPAAAEGLVVIVKNDGAAAADVFPATSDKIDDGSANAAISLRPGAVVVFRAIDAVNWESDVQVGQNSGVYLTGTTGVQTSLQIAGFYPTVAQNNITAGTGGAILVTNYLTTINTDGGGDAFTLANGTQTGQLKKIILIADGGGDGVVTPATALLGGATTITFNDASDYVILIWNGSAWAVLENSGTTIA
jgi:hypothetical protein